MIAAAAFWREAVAVQFDDRRHLFYHHMTIFVLNSPVLTSYGEWRFTGPIQREDARTRIGTNFQSTVGHEGSAAFLSRFLDLVVPMNRVTITMEPGDVALVLRIKARMPEGRVLTEEEFAAIPFELGWLERLG